MEREFKGELAGRLADEMSAHDMQTAYKVVGRVLAHVRGVSKPSLNVKCLIGDIEHLQEILENAALHATRAEMRESLND